VVKVTPWIRQYLEIKERHRDAILFFRMGDFYEMFFEDAEVAARALEIALTSRNRDSEEPIPMCGVPFHAAGLYINKLVSQGHKVAICEQVEDPKKARGLVKREVTWVASPGLILDAELLEAKANNFLAAICPPSDHGWGLAFLDLSTGEFLATEVEGLSAALGELTRLNPSQFLIPPDRPEDLIPRLRRLFPTQFIEEMEASAFGMEDARGLLFRQLEAGGLEELSALPGATRACGALLSYLDYAGGGQAAHIDRVRVYQVSDFMVVDETSARNLELTETLFDRTRKGSLLGCLDKTLTGMGGRRLRSWLRYPLLSLEAIEARLDAVGELAENHALRERLRLNLDSLYDLERLTARVAMRRATPRDLLALKDSLGRVPEIRLQLLGAMTRSLASLAEGLDALEDVSELIGRAIADDPPLAVRDGGAIREGYSAEMDKLIGLTREGKGWIARLEAEERSRTGINSLKVGYNRVFGYYIEVSRTNLPLVPQDYIRKQTLSNAERYVTEGLKEQEALILTAEERKLALEQELFDELVSSVASHSHRLRETASRLADLDALSALAHVAVDNDYVRPRPHLGDSIEIRGGRHPVVEREVFSEQFVPNDILLDNGRNQLLIITGPNMAGKSTILRQAAIICIMAQMGSFVPAESAEIGLVDRIFTRVGAMDSLSRGQSTFMVEMTETATILSNLTERSLVLLDEVGRGTSTFDGLSIAWAVAEFLNGWKGRGVKTLFATHYHELCRLAESRKRIRNLNVAVREWNDQIIFLHQLVPGGASRSYGVQVARLAGLPNEVISRAKELLAAIEAGDFSRAAQSAAGASVEGQLDLFRERETRAVERLKGLDPMRMTPLEALALLHELKQELS